MCYLTLMLYLIIYSCLTGIHVFIMYHHFFKLQLLLKIARSRMCHLLLGGAGVTDAQSNRDYVIQKMSNEIHEIIRVLQLTTYDEEEWDADDITVMKKAQV